MKYIFIIPRMGGGGAERVVSILANALSADENNDVTLLTIVGGDSFYPLKSEVHYKSIGATISKKNFFARTLSKALFFPKSLIHIYKELKGGHYDVVLSFLTEADILVGCCKLLGLKFNHVCSERNDPTKRSKFQLFILNMIYKRAELFVCQGKNVFDFYLKVPNEIKCIIPNPIESNTLPERKEPKNKRIVAVGRLNKQKNFSLLINSFSKVQTSFPDYRLDIYGEGPERAKLENLITDLNLKEKVSLIGAVDNVKERICDAELFVLSSDHEGFPNALLEAMAIGLPVISTDFPTGIAKELVSQQGGIVVPVGDEPSLTSAMYELLSDDAKRSAMGTYNRQACQAYYAENIVTMWGKNISSLKKHKMQNRGEAQ